MAENKRFIIQLGDGGDPETFAFTCGGNARSVNFTNNLGETTYLDCDAPLDAPAVISRALESQDTSMTISGSVMTQAFPEWRAWADSGEARNVKIFMDETAANNGGYWTLPAYLQSFELSSEGVKTTSFTANIQGAGKRVWTDAA